MPPATRPPARCLVRVDPQPWGVLITVRVDRGLADGPSEPRRFAAPEEALAAVAVFLADYAVDDQR